MGGFPLLDKLKDVLIGFLLASALLLPTLYYNGALDNRPDPYTVESYEIRNIQPNGNFDFVGNFNKPDRSCTLATFAVFGNYTGEWFLIPHVDTLEDDFTGDRPAGEHTLRITIGPLSYGFDSIEVRTRHYCDDTSTPEVERITRDKVFARIPRDDFTK